MHTLARVLDDCNVAWRAAGAPAYRARCCQAIGSTGIPIEPRECALSAFELRDYADHRAKLSTIRVSNFLLLVMYNTLLGSFYPSYVHNLIRLHSIRLQITLQIDSRKHHRVVEIVSSAIG